MFLAIQTNFFGGRASLLELLWTLIGLLIIVFCSYNFVDAISDKKKALKKKVNGVVIKLTNHHIRLEAIRVSIGFAFSSVGILSMATRPAIKNYPITTVGIAVTALFFYIAVAVLTKSVMDARLRHSLR